MIISLYMYAFPNNAVLSLVEMAENLLALEGTKFLLSERFSQDQVEEYFGKQRERGAQNDNLTVDRFLHNHQTLATLSTISIGPLVKGNVRGHPRPVDSIEQLSLPLMKRPKLSKKNNLLLLHIYILYIYNYPVSLHTTRTIVQLLYIYTLCIHIIMYRFTHSLVIHF